MPYSLWGRQGNPLLAAVAAPHWQVCLCGGSNSSSNSSKPCVCPLCMVSACMLWWSRLHLMHLMLAGAAWTHAPLARSEQMCLDTLASRAACQLQGCGKEGRHWRQ